MSKPRKLALFLATRSQLVVQQFDLCRQRRDEFCEPVGNIHTAMNDSQQDKGLRPDIEDHHVLARRITLQRLRQAFHSAQEPRILMNQTQAVLPGRSP